MKAILFDIDGVIYEGERPVPGAADVVDWVRGAGIPHLFLNNTSSRPRRAIADKLARMGMEIPADQILTPPVAAAGWLRSERPGPAALFVRQSTREDFEGIDLLDEGADSGAGAVVVGDMGEQWDYPTLNRAFRLLMGEPRPRLIALGMTRYWKAGDGLRLDAAPFVVALEHAAGMEALVLGKPAEGFFQAALHRVGTQPSAGPSGPASRPCWCAPASSAPPIWRAGSSPRRCWALSPIFRNGGGSAGIELPGALPGPGPGSDWTPGDHRAASRLPRAGRPSTHFDTPDRPGATGRLPPRGIRR